LSIASRFWNDMTSNLITVLYSPNYSISKSFVGDGLQSTFESLKLLTWGSMPLVRGNEPTVGFFVARLAIIEFSSIIELRVKLNGATLKVCFVWALAHGEHETKGNFNRNRDVAAEREHGFLFLYVFNRLNIY
jgi:hypothetical protein